MSRRALAPSTSCSWQLSRHLIGQSSQIVTGATGLQHLAMLRCVRRPWTTLIVCSVAILEHVARHLHRVRDLQMKSVSGSIWTLHIGLKNVLGSILASRRCSSLRRELYGWLSRRGFRG
eukprot:1217216-Prymnesium_polylepis.1